MNTKEMIEVMQAFIDGKEIEMRKVHYKDWYSVSVPDWDWLNCFYRIKKELKHVAFDWEDREKLRGRWIRNKKDKNEYLITSFKLLPFAPDDYKPFLIIDVGDNYSFTEIFELFEFLDCSSCGKLEE